MLRYKNISNKTLTFYGVPFNSNETKEVPGFINHVKMIRVQETSEAKKPKEIITSLKQELPKAEKRSKRKYTKKNSN